MKELICITCPKGCHLKVDEANDYAVSGNACPRGAIYGRNELLNPVRVVTSTVRLEGGPLPRLNVKTDKPLPKDKMFECMKLLDDVVNGDVPNQREVLLKRMREFVTETETSCN